MAEKSGFFDAHIIGEEYDRVYLAEDFAKYFSSFITNGIFGGKSNELMVRQASPANMTISVSSGHAWINGYKYENTNDLSLAIDVADGVLNRIDAVVLRWGKAERKIWATIKKGTPAAKPVAPTLQRDSEYYELKLAEVSVIAGAVSIVQSNITDTRLFSDVCGYVVGAVQQFDTTYFGAQLNAYVNEYAAEYKKWLDEMEVSGADELNEVLERLNALIDGDTVGLLTNEIERTKDRVLDIENGKPAENSYLVNDKIVALDIYEDAQLSMTSLIDFVQQGAGTASPNNVRHIVGHKTLNLSRHGKNMWTTDAVYPLGNPAGGKLLYDAVTQKYTIKANAASYTGNIYKLPVPIPAGVKVTATMFLEKGKLDVGTIVFGGFNDASEQWQCDVRVPEGGTLAGRIVTKTLTTALPITHFRAFIYSDNVVTEDIVLRMQFEFGDAATTFELYRGSVFTTAFDNTIYGGEYNWETGKLTINKTCITLTGTENVELSEGVYGGHNLFVIRNSTNNVNTLKAAVSSHGRQSNTAFELYADVGDFALWVSPERNASWFGILSDVSTVSEFKAYLAEQYANGTPYTMVYENYVPVVVWYVGQNVFAIQGKNYISSNAGNTKVLYTHVSKTYVEANFARKSVNGVVQSENADYAEVAEWNDGNPNGEDRVGYFVCVDVDTPGINIRKAGTFDNVRGVTMRNPAFSANCTPDKFDENGNLLPQFNHVGFAGFIPVIDNGTCTVGSYCMPGEDGTAVPSINSYGYQVIERIDETHVLILVEPGADGHVRMQNEMIKYVNDNAAPASLVDHVDVVAINNNKLRKDSYISDVLNVDLNNPDGTANRSGYFDGSAQSSPPNVAFGVRDVYFVNPGFVIVEARCFMTDSTTKIWRCTYNANVSSGWLGWNEVYDSGHKPTAAEIGAAPASLATDMTTADAFITSFLPLNSINRFLSEFLLIDTQNPFGEWNRTGHFTTATNAIPQGFSHGIREVLYFNTNFIVVKATGWDNVNLNPCSGRIVYRGSSIGWTEWEWDNPPMQPGVEYRTTERYEGKVVYTKLIDFGYLPNNTYKSVGIAVLPQHIVSIEGKAYNSVEKTTAAVFPLFYGNAPAASFFLNNSGGLVVEACRDMSYYTAKFLIKYTKH